MASKKQTIFISIAIVVLATGFAIGAAVFRERYEKIRWNGWSTYAFQTQITDIALDKTGLIWVATDGNGLAQLHDDERVIYNTDNTEIPSNHILSIDFDEQGCTWILAMHSIGTGFGGADVIVFDGETWNISSHVDNLYGELTVGPDGRIWVTECCGSNMGIDYFDGYTWHRVTEENSDLSGSPEILTPDEQGRAWIGTSGSVDIFDGTNWLSYNGFWGVAGIVFDQQGNAWLSDQKGLYVFQNDIWDTVKSYGTYYYRQTMAVDSQGRVWIGVGEYGIFVLDGANWINYNIQNSPLPTHIVSNITFDRNGSPWISGGNKLFYSKQAIPASPLRPMKVALYNWIFSVPGNILVIFLLAILWIAHVGKIWRPVLIGIIPGLIILLMTGSPMITMPRQSDYYGFNFSMLVLLSGGVASIIGSAIDVKMKRVNKIALGIIFAILGSLLGFMLQFSRYTLAP